MTSFVVLTVAVAMSIAGADVPRVFPGATWETRTPEEVGLDKTKLDAFAAYMGGRGCIVRHGYLVYTWGDAAKAGDVASACKPWNTHFLMVAIEQGRIAGPDEKVSRFVPCLDAINADLNHKDRNITFRHVANQTSCYGVREEPGTAFDYNDWQMALFFDALYIGAYGATYETVDDAVLHPLLTRKIACEDEVTFCAFGADHHPGRLKISPRDFARFGWLYLNEGHWNGTQIISADHARMVVTSPVAAAIPRTRGEAAEMCPDARSLGSQKIPDNQTDHFGSYSWLWWVNGVDRDGQRRWPHVSEDVYAALGHRHGMRGMAVFPSLDIVVSWNDSGIGDLPEEAKPLDEAFPFIQESAGIAD